MHYQPKKCKVKWIVVPLICNPQDIVVVTVVVVAVIDMTVVEQQ